MIKKRLHRGHAYEAIEAIVKVKRKNDCNFFKDCAMAM